MLPKKYNRLGTIISLFLVIILVYLAAKNIRNIETFIPRFGAAGPLVTIFLYGLFAITPISTDPLTIVSSILFGPILGILTSWMGNNLAAFIEYYFGMRIGKISNFQNYQKKLPFGLGRLPINSPWFLTIGRLFPWFGSKFVSLTAGIYHVPLRRFAWTTTLINLIGSILFSYGGYQVINLLKSLTN